MKRIVNSLIIAMTVWAVWTMDAPVAEACGCLSPPEPVGDEEYAINQQAEQIIFEVEEGFVTAHVLIKYAGNPESFAWIVPVPSVPELSLSSGAAFGLLDQATVPRVSVATNNLCPDSPYYCAYHPLPTCGSINVDAGPRADANAMQGGADAGASSPSAPPVDIIDRQTIGSYDTVIFSAGDMSAAVGWLQSEGFIVNDTMAPYMQPYADGGMLFVASKLIPGADVSEIHPLKMRFEAPAPMIPLKLTAVASEPHLTVTAYIFGDEYYQPAGLPLVEIDRSALARIDGRTNYPMVLARAIDDAGGDGFVAEYLGDPIVPDFDRGTGCCNSGWDVCNIEWDGVCSCPGNELDAADCAEQEDLLAGVALLEELSAKHSRLSRLTTRLSPEEMTFDPMFEPLASSGPLFGALQLSNAVDSLSSCESDIIETRVYDDIMARQQCATTYCGAGECVATTDGAGCNCDDGYAARLFTDLDGRASVTCVPAVAPVDLSAGGSELRDACRGIDCGMGACVDVGGFPTCQCEPWAAATQGTSPIVAACRAIEVHTATAGARNYTEELAQVRVCAPPPPTGCGDGGWLQMRQVHNPGELCASSVPDPALLVPPAVLTCEDLGLPPVGGDMTGGCGCDTATTTPAGGAVLLAGLAMLLIGWRRRDRAGHEPDGNHGSSRDTRR